jgi:hypothetical protein
MLSRNWISAATLKLSTVDSLCPDSHASHRQRVHERLGIVSPSAVVDGWLISDKVEVWVLGAGREWSRRYNVQVMGNATQG